VGRDCRRRESVRRAFVGLPESATLLLGARGGRSQFFHDSTSGSNAYNGFNGIPGYRATAEWDFTTGWGTPNLGKLVVELAKQQQLQKQMGLWGGDSRPCHLVSSPSPKVLAYLGTRLGSCGGHRREPPFDMPRGLPEAHLEMRGQNLAQWLEPL